MGPENACIASHPFGRLTTWNENRLPGHRIPWIRDITSRPDKAFSNSRFTADTDKMHARSNLRCKRPQPMLGNPGSLAVRDNMNFDALGATPILQGSFTQHFKRIRDLTGCRRDGP